MKARPVIALCTALILVGCIGTRLQFWQSEAFTEQQGVWRYYRWEDQPLVADASSRDNIAIVDSAVRNELGLLLGQKNYLEDAARAQFEVDYRVGDESAVGQQGLLSPTDHYERIKAGPNAEYEVSSRFYTHRTLGYHEVSHLKLTFYDIESRRIVWQGSASKLVDDPTASESKVQTAAVDAIRKMMRKFPPAVQP